MENIFNIKATDFWNKETILESIKNNCLSLRMTNYVYNCNFVYEKIHRIRNHFDLKTVIYFD